MNYQLHIKEISEHVISYYKERSPGKLLYHSLEHTQNVVRAAEEIVNHYELSKEEHFAVISAAWFHDTGYLDGHHAHEEKSAKLAAQYLNEKKVPVDLVELISTLILSTKIPQCPANLLEKIVCDADLFHLGSNDYKDQNKLLRKETEKRTGDKIDKQHWYAQEIIFLQAHIFHTEYCQILLGDQKKLNIEEIKLKLKSQLQTEGTPEGTRDKSDRPARGIETMFKITSGNNQRLSDMADNKAHILITVNSIILSAIISLVLRKLEENPYLTVPTMILLSICLAAMIFAILATRPSIPKGKFTLTDLDARNVNLLFFGNFYKMKYEEYAQGMFMAMENHNFLYGMLTRDVFMQGVVLGKKYRFLRIAYNTFMYGLIISVLAFIGTSVLNNQGNKSRNVQIHSTDKIEKLTNARTKSSYPVILFQSTLNNPYNTH